MAILLANARTTATHAAAAAARGDALSAAQLQALGGGADGLPPPVEWTGVILSAPAIIPDPKVGARGAVHACAHLVRRSHALRHRRTEQTGQAGAYTHTLCAHTHARTHTHTRAHTRALARSA
jgi:hypothetical protein